MNFYYENNILNPSFNPDYSIRRRNKKLEDQRIYREILDKQIQEKKNREKEEKMKQQNEEYQKNKNILKEEEEMKERKEIFEKDNKKIYKEMLDEQIKQKKQLLGKDKNAKLNDNSDKNIELQRQKFENWISNNGEYRNLSQIHPAENTEKTEKLKENKTIEENGIDK